jgi:multidrug resistance protein MdtO
VPASVDHPSESAPGGAEKPGLFVADAFTNPEYVHFAIKGTLAALFCYLCYIGFDYPGIGTSMITCIMVSLTTAGATRQKGILRFAGVAVGGLISTVALIYVLPHVDTIGGFLLIFGACIAAAAWVYFGSPRISYAGFQVMLVLCMALLHSGPSVNLTVIRDRIIGIVFGLSVLAIVEHVLWPVRATEALRLRVAELLLHPLAELARTGVTVRLRRRAARMRAGGVNESR